MENIALQKWNLFNGINFGKIGFWSILPRKTDLRLWMLYMEFAWNQSHILYVAGLNPAS